MTDIERVEYLVSKARHELNFVLEYVYTFPMSFRDTIPVIREMCEKHLYNPDDNVKRARDDLEEALLNISRCPICASQKRGEMKYTFPMSFRDTIPVIREMCEKHLYMYINGVTCPTIDAHKWGFYPPDKGGVDRSRIYNRTAPRGRGHERPST